MRPKVSTVLALGLPVVLALAYFCLVIKPSAHANPAVARATAEESARLWDKCNSLYREGKYQELLPDLHRLLDAHPGSHIYLEMAAQAYGQLGDHQREAEYWEKYFDRAPRPTTACPQIGQAYQKLGKAKEALDAFERCLALDPMNADSIFFLAHAVEMAGQVDRAAELYARGVKIAPEDNDLRIGLARVQQRQGKLKLAMHTILPVLNTDPSSADALLVAGLVLRSEGDLTGSKQYLQRGVQLADNYLDFHIVLAQIAEREKNYGEAIRQYDRVLQQEPNNQNIRSRRDALREKQ